jgi:hypothetical protein
LDACEDQRTSLDLDDDPLQLTTAVALLIDSEFTITKLSVKSSIKIPARKTNGTAFRHFDVAWVNNTEPTGITANASDDFGFG